MQTLNSVAGSIKMNSNRLPHSGKSLNDMLLTLQDYIRSQQTSGHEHEPTPTEIFALVSTTLTSGSGQEKLREMLEIVTGVIPSASTTIVRSQFKHLSQSLLHIAKARSDDVILLNSTLVAIGKFFQYQVYKLFFLF